MKNILKYLPWVIVAVGIILRLREYLYSRSFWVDEGWLVLNFMHRDLAGILKPLSDNQHAPYAFLIIEKLLSQVFGTSELVFRFFPLVCGIISIFLFKKIADKLFKPLFSNLALAIFVSSDLLIRYSTEFKQYSAEVMVNLIIYVLVIEYGLDDLFEKKWLILILVGIISLLFSHTVILTLVALSLVYLFELAKKQKWKKVVLQTGILILWPVVFLGLYLKDLTQAYANRAFLDEWTYFSIIPTSPKALSADLHGIYQMFFELSGSPSLWIALVLFVLGAGALFRKQTQHFFIFALPLILGLIASNFHKYPLVTRVFLFSTPTLIVFATYGAYFLYQKFRRFKVLIFVILAIGMLGSSIVVASSYLIHPREIEEMKPALSYYISNKQPGDYLYVFYASQAAFYYYAQPDHIEPSDYYVGKMSRNSWLSYLQDINTHTKGKQRVWFLFSHNVVWAQMGEGIMTEEDYIVSYLAKKGKLQYVQNFQDASIYLFKF